MVIAAKRWFCLMSIIGCLLVSEIAWGSESRETGDEVKPGQQVENSLEIMEGDESITIRYWLFVPEQYDASKPMPLMLFMHGAGERGDDLKKVKQWGPPKLVEKRKDFPFILISPQCPAEQWWRADLMVSLVEHVAAELAVDHSRIYVTGLSMGGFGTWSLLSAKPELFAAAAPICGGGDPKKVERFKNIPIWVFHGDADEVVPVERSRDMVDALKAVDAPVKYTEYEGVGHNSWSKTYANEDLYKWLLEHQRDESKGE